MLSLSYTNSSPIKSCAKWLILSMVFVWLVGCAAMPGKKVANRDPFQDQFSCGEKVPKGRAAQPGYKAPTETAAANSGMNSAKGSIDARNNTAQNAAYSAPVYNPYANPAQTNPAAVTNAGYTNPNHVDRASGDPAFADPVQSNPAMAGTVVKKSGIRAGGSRAATQLNSIESYKIDAESSDFDRPGMNGATTRTADATPEFGMSSANAMPAERRAVQTSYEAPASNRSTSEEAPSQGNWYDADK